VPKKGLDTLLHALSVLPDDLYWTWTHIAGGPLLADLKALALTLGISHRTQFLGSQAQARVLEAYRENDVFVLPCRIGSDGNRDGLPNVIVEAQSQGMPVLSTPISGIPELIENGTNGLLVPPNDPESLANAIVELAKDPMGRNTMGQAGDERVRKNFNAENEIDELLGLFARDASDRSGQ